MYKNINLRIILLVLSLMTFISAWIGGFLYFSSVKRTAFEEANKQAVFHAETIRNQLSFSLRKNLNSVRALAGLKDLTDALLRKDIAPLAKVNFILDHFKNAYQMDVCYLIDREGKTIASSNRNASDSFVGRNYAFRPYFQNAVNGNPVFSSGYMAVGMTSGKRGVYYSHPVYEGSNDTPIGVAVMKEPIDSIEKEFIKAYQGIVILSDPHGIVFLSNRNDLVLHTLSKLNSKEIIQVKKDGRFGEGPWKWSGLKIIDDTHAVDNLGNTYLFNQLKMQNYPEWNLIYLNNVNSIFKRLSMPIIRVTGYLILTWCIFVGLAVFILYRKANHEINQRHKAEKALNKAHDDLERRVAKRTDDLKQTVKELQKEIVERKRAEEAFCKSEEQYRTLTNNLSVGVFRTTPGPKGIYIKINPAYMKMFGFNNEKELLSTYAYALYQYPKDRERFSRKILKYGAVRNEEILFKKKDGTSVIGSVTAVAVKDDNGVVKHYDGIIEDISELKKAKEEAQKRRDEMTHLGRVATMGELAASLAHELNQPLAAILTNAQAALRFCNKDSPDLDEVRDILKDIVADDKRAGEVIHRLRSFFRKGEFESAKVDINDLILDAVSLIKSEAIMRNVTIVTLLDKSLHQVLGDSIHLQQAIINFILNAAEAMTTINDVPRKIIISTEKENDRRVKVGIRDSGMGIDKEALDQILEPFYTTKPSGMGMGLSINRSIIEAHSGRIWAQNHPVRGAVFYFTLPFVRGQK